MNDEYISKVSREELEAYARTARRLLQEQEQVIAQLRIDFRDAMRANRDHMVSTFGEHDGGVS